MPFYVRPKVSLSQHLGKLGSLEMCIELTKVKIYVALRGKLSLAQESGFVSVLKNSKLHLFYDKPFNNILKVLGLFMNITGVA